MERDLVKDKTLCNAFGETFTEENFSPYLRIFESFLFCGCESQLEIKERKHFLQNNFHSLHL